MKEYQKVQVINNKYEKDGIHKDSIGYIINIYDDKYCEVEFSNSQGITYALQTICINDFIVLEEM